MFPPTITGRPKKRSLRELVREAVGTAAAFATLGEAQAPHRARTAPTREHPHRRSPDRHPRRRRPGQVAPRAQVCVSQVPHQPARGA